MNNLESRQHLVNEHCSSYSSQHQQLWNEIHYGNTSKKPRKKLNLAEQKAKLTASKAKVAEQESKIAVA
jgi:hypothetical protein